MQQVDLTTLRALCSELRAQWLPARLEQVYQCDRFTLQLALRTLQHRGWLTVSWHPQAARLGIGAAPPRSPDTFTFSEQLRHQLNGLALVAIAQVSPWERVVDLQFARRPQEAAQWHLYVEVMGKYSNAILTTADQTVVTAAHQVNANQSRVRTIQTGQPYEAPPALTGPTPTLAESLDHWRDRLTLIPGPLKSTLVQQYRGLSSLLVLELLAAADLAPDQTTDTLTAADWSRLFQRWQQWLKVLETEQFQPTGQPTGYSVLGWQGGTAAPNVQQLVETYYTRHLQQQTFQQLRQQLLQKLGNALAKLQAKADLFMRQMADAAQAEQYRGQADLLMAHLHLWQPGLRQIVLPDFETGEPRTLALNPERNGVQNAQALYKRHQKLKRSRQHVQPLLDAVQAEIRYLEQAIASIETLERFQSPDDLAILQEVRDELIQQQYLSDPDYRGPSREKTDFYRYCSPSGWEILIGRNNRQNEQLSFRVASAYDIWLHSQEIAGSHVLLRLEAGTQPDTQDLQFAANLAAYYSRGRHSGQVPVVWTESKNLYKPKGAKPGMAIYKHEQVVWGNPHAGAIAPLDNA